MYLGQFWDNFSDFPYCEDSLINGSGGAFISSYIFLDDFTLSACDSFSLEIPNVFTPNADGIYDEFELLATGHVDKIAWHVYNRWGQIVFESNELHAKWNGMLNGTPLEEGVYLIEVAGTTFNKPFSKSAYVHLQR